MLSLNVLYIISVLCISVINWYATVNIFAKISMNLWEYSSFRKFHIFFRLVVETIKFCENQKAHFSIRKAKTFMNVFWKVYNQLFTFFNEIYFLALIISCIKKLLQSCSNLISISNYKPVASSSRIWKCQI